MGKSKSLALRLWSVPLLLGLLGGCATTEQAAESGDPLEPMNRAIYNFNDVLDRNLIGPLADGYVAVTPEPMRIGVTNFFDNLRTPWTVINSVGQGKILEALEASGRFLVNSVFGLGGVIDFASGIGMPRYDEDLGQTLAVWGMPEGAYLVLPILGPNSLRDAPDWAGRFLMPSPTDALADGADYILPAVNGVNTRANLSSAVRVRERSALDPYIFTREAYRQRRNFLIYDGDPPVEGFDTQ